MHYIRQAKGIESAGEVVLIEKKKKKNLGFFLDSTVTVNCIMRRLQGPARCGVAE